MCRLFAYVAPHDRAVTDLLEAGEFTSFRALSSLHCDGWGMAWLPSSHAGTSAHVATIRSVNRALDDDTFSEMAAAQLGRAGLIHLRSATAGLPICEENTHPFLVDGWAFAHNGSIANSERILRLLSEKSKTKLRGNTDSELYFLLILQRVSELGDVVAALRQTVSDIRTVCGLGCLNAILMSSDVLVAIQCQGDTPPPLDDLRASVTSVNDLPAGHDEDYYQLRLSRRGDSIVISSTGVIGKNWEPLLEDSMIVIDLHDNVVTICPFKDRVSAARFPLATDSAPISDISAHR